MKAFGNVNVTSFQSRFFYHIFDESLLISFIKQKFWPHRVEREGERETEREREIERERKREGERDK